MKQRIIIFVCLICLLVIGIGAQPNPVVAIGNTYYVATTGNDITGNGSIGSPWATPQRAANVMVAGDTCFIKAGTYGSSGNGQRIITKNNGSASNWITFQNYNNDVVTIFSSGLYSNLGIQNSYIQFIGLRCVGDANSYAGAAITSAISNILIKNCYFNNFQIGGIFMDNSNDRSYITIDGCEFYQTNTTADLEMVDINNTNNFEIKNCTIHAPVYPTGRGGISTTGSSNGSIHNNLVYGCSAVGIYIGPSFGHAGSNVNVYNNIVHDCGQAGLNWSDEIGLGQTTTSINFNNNIVYNNARGFETDFYAGLGTVSFSLINNTFYNNGIAGDTLLVPNHQYFSNCVIRNNIYYSAVSNMRAIDYPDYANGGVTIDHNLFYNSGGSWSSNSKLGTNYVLGNPLLVAPPTDFRLSAGSPAIDVGSSTNAPSMDYAGTPRPQGAGYDIGAYEYEDSSGLIPSVTTNAASIITTSGANLNGRLTTLGSTSPVTVSFDWGIDTNYTGGNIAATPSSITNVPTTFTASLSGLTAGVIYHYRAKAVGAATVYGSDQQFTTSTSPPPLVVTTSSLPNGAVNVYYSQTLVATGGTTPYTWTIASGTLPAGLSLSPSGVISGTPTTAGGPTSITFKVTDNTSAMATQALSITTVYAVWDVNMDGAVNVLDIILITQHFGETGTPNWIRQDVNSDGVINVLDCILVGQHRTG